MYFLPLSAQNALLTTGCWSLNDCHKKPYSYQKFSQQKFLKNLLEYSLFLEFVRFNLVWSFRELNFCWYVIPNGVFVLRYDLISSYQKDLPSWIVKLLINMESSNCLNINSPTFNSDLYYKKLLKVIITLFSPLYWHRSAVILELPIPEVQLMFSLCFRNVPWNSYWIKKMKSSEMLRHFIQICKHWSTRIITNSFPPPKLSKKFVFIVFLFWSFLHPFFIIEYFTRYSLVDENRLQTNGKWNGFAYREHEFNYLVFWPDF